MLTGASYYENQEGFHSIFALAPRITIASCIAFLAGSFINATVLTKMKVRIGGKKLAGHHVLSSVAGEAADSQLFFPIAFLGVLAGKELLNHLLLQFVLKTLYEIILLPLTTWIIRKLKAYKDGDVYTRTSATASLEEYENTHKHHPLEPGRPHHTRQAPRLL